MPISAQCSACQTTLKIPDNLAGKKVKCVKCGNAFQVPAVEPGTEVTPRKPTSVKTPAPRSSLVPMLLIGGALAVVLMCVIVPLGVGLAWWALRSSPPSPQVAQDDMPSGFSRLPAPTNPVVDIPARPAEPVPKVEGPEVKPIDPPVKPVDPVDPPAKPVDPPAKPVDPPAKPVDPPAKPVDPPAKPVDPAVKPVDPPAKPVDPPAKPVEPDKGEGEVVADGFDARNAARRMARVKQKGGNDASEAAIAAGLLWLSKHQAPDGHWSFKEFHKDGKCNCTGPAKFDDVAATALGVLPFLGAGQNHKVGPYAKQVDRALKSLILKQNPKGELNPLMYSHGLATLALCEAYGLTHDPILRGPAQRALNYIIDAQSAEGGWRYARKDKGFDTSVGGWQLQALWAGRVAGLQVPDETFKGCVRWLDAASIGNGSAYGYTNRDTQGASTTAIGLLGREYFGVSPRNQGLLAGTRSLQAGWKTQAENTYYMYYATQVIYYQGGLNWENWNPNTRDRIIAAQDQGKDERLSHQKGSWFYPKGPIPGGRLTDTSLSLLTLEVYYRQMPLPAAESAPKKE
jgi:hypothetical protein